MRSVLKAAANRLPYWMRHAQRSVRSYHRARKPTFHGKFSEFPRNTVIDNGYESDDWVSQTLRSITAINDGSDTAAARSLLPAAVASVQNFKDATSILDFGGATGIDFAVLQKTVPWPVKYHVVDQPALCEAGRIVWRGSNEITFSSELPKPRYQFDIVYSNTSIHCVPDYIALVKALASYKAKMIVLARSWVADTEFVRLRTGMGTPVWVMSLPRIKAAMKEAGYLLSYAQSNGDQYNVDNYEPHYRVSDTTNLIFRLEA